MERQVIIVARDGQIRRALGRICRGRGCRVETVRSLATTMELMARVPIRVLVAEVSAEDAHDGVELAQVVHERNPAANCFLIVNDESSDFLSSPENEPWLHFVHKPFPMLRFASDVMAAIETSQVGDQPKN